MYKRDDMIVENNSEIYGQRIVTFDLMKLFMSLIIVLHHFQQVTGIRFEYINFSGGKFYFGYIVELFFMISGFLIVKSFVEKMKIKSNGGGVWIRNNKKLF